MGGTSFHRALRECTSLVELRIRKVPVPKSNAKALDILIPRLKSLKILETCGDLLSPAVFLVPDLALDRLIVCHSSTFTMEVLHEALTGMRGKPRPAVKRFELITFSTWAPKQLYALELTANAKGMGLLIQRVPVAGGR